MTIGAFAPESEVAELLRSAEKANEGVSIGSYPFFKDGKVGGNFVVRSEDEALARRVADGLADSPGSGRLCRDRRRDLIHCTIGRTGLLPVALRGLGGAAMDPATTESRPDWRRDWRRPSVSQRGLAIGLTILAELVFLMILLGLEPASWTDRKASRPTTVDLIPADKPPPPPTRRERRARRAGAGRSIRCRNRRRRGCRRCPTPNRHSWS